MPDSLGTDLHTSSMTGGMKDMSNVMSKFLNMGMSVQEVVLRSTSKPAGIIKRPDLGHLSEGAVADVAVFRLVEGNFGFLDARLTRMSGTRKLECELTLREGRVVWDLNGIAARAWDSPPEK
jgi:dihydroorotase